MDQSAETKVFHKIPRTLTALLLVAVLMLGPVGFLPLASAQSPSITITSNFLLRNDITFSSEGFIIDAENIILDCDGHRIRGSGSGTGITLNGTYGVTVTKCDVSNFEVGFALLSSNDNLLIGNRVNGNTFGGFILELSSDRNVIQGNTVKGNGGQFSGLGLGINDGNDNIVKENLITENRDGIQLRGFGPLKRSTQNNLIQDNLIIDNGNIGVKLIGSRTQNNVVKNNEINGNGDKGVFFLAGASFNVAKGNTVSGNGRHGILIASPLNSVLENTIIGNGRHGILISSALNSVFDNTITGNGKRGLLITEDGSDNQLRDNRISRNTGDGVLVSGDRNDFSHNIMEANGRHGIFFTGQSQENLIRDNVMSANAEFDIKDRGDKALPNIYTNNVCTTSKPAMC